MWYDGYVYDKGLHIYNPNSVIKAVNSGKIKSHWAQSSATDNLLHYIEMDFDGLTKTTAELMGGSSVLVKLKILDKSYHFYYNSNTVGIVVILVQLYLQKIKNSQLTHFTEGGGADLLEVIIKFNFFLIKILEFSVLKFYNDYGRLNK